MLSSVGKKYTVGDVYKEAAKLLKDEMGGLKKGGLSKTEEIKMEEMAKILSKTVLKEMKIV